MHTGDVVFAVLVVGIPALAALGMLDRHRARNQGWSQARGGFVNGILSRRHAVRLEKLRHYNGMLREAERHRNKLAEQEARQAREAGHGAGPRHPRSGTVRGNVIRLGDPPADEPRDSDPQPPASGRRKRRHLRISVPKRKKQAPRSQAAAGGQSRPVPSRPPEPPAQDSNPLRPAPGRTEPLEGVIVADSEQALTVPGVTQVAEGLRALYDYAMAGNIQAKRGAVLGGAYIGRQAALTFLTLSRAMGEPGMHYGSEVTEKIARMSAAFTVAASEGSEADGELFALLKTTLEELLASGRQAPHHTELQETGIR